MCTVVERIGGKCREMSKIEGFGCGRKTKIALSASRDLRSTSVDLGVSLSDLSIQLGLL